MIKLFKLKDHYAFHRISTIFLYFIVLSQSYSSIYVTLAEFREFSDYLLHNN